MENKLAIATVSLGQHPSHSLPDKILAAAQHGFAAVEMVYADLAAYALSKSPETSIEDAAREIAQLCTAQNIAILSLNPLKNFEGHPSPLTQRMDTARHWVHIARLLGARFLQMPSQFDTGNSTGEEDVIIPELQKMVDMTAELAPGLGIAYEAVAWGSYVNTWQDSWRVVKLVDRANFGLCLDSFHVVARLWGDITAESGKQDGNVDELLGKSLDEFVTACPIEKIFYVQFSDGERYSPPLAPGHRFYDPTFPSALTWSRNTRPFPLEEELGAYMPVVQVAHAWLVQKGWKGYVSLEVFDWRMRDEARRPVDNAARGMNSWKKLTTAVATMDPETSV